MCQNPGGARAATRTNNINKTTRPVLTDDLRQFIESMLLALAALLPIVNPLGAAPVYLAKTVDLTAPEHADLARR
ncbi:MAG TPA: hypothetical protein VIF33_04875, partial [Casimicrobiaceae bacterium]